MEGKTNINPKWLQQRVVPNAAESIWNSRIFCKLER